VATGGGTAGSARGRLPVHLVRTSLRRPRRTLLLCAVVVCTCALGLVRLRIETTTDSVLNRATPEWSFYQRSQALFGGDEFLTVAIEAPEPWDADTLRRVGRLTDALEGLPGVRRVDSLASVPVVSATPGGDLRLDPALRGLPDDDRAAAAAVRERLRLDRVAPASLVSNGGRVFALNVLLEHDAEQAYPAIFQGIDGALSGSRAWVSGVPTFRLKASETTRSELLFFVPITIGLIGLLLFVVFRSAPAVLIPLVTSGAGAVVLLGLMGALDTPLTLTTAILPSIILALGCAYVMHLITAASGVSGREALADALEPIALPIALSGLTTTIGFVAISLVHIDAIRFVGGYGALGVLAVLVLSLTAAPAALALFPLPAARPAQARWLEEALGRRLVSLSARAGGWVIATWVVALLLLGTGISRMHVETDATRWFPPGHEIRDAYEAIRARLSGISPVNVVVESESGAPITEPEALRAIDALTAYLGAQPQVGKALSLADPLRQLHGGFSGDESQPLPEGRALAEQYLLLLESVDQLEDLVTDDRSAANIVLRANDNGSAHLLEIADEVDAWWAEHGAPGFRATTTGIMYEFGRATDEVAQGQIRGLLFALAAIAAVLFAIFRQAPLALVALLPNAVPVVMIFGFMGLAGLPVDAGTVLVGSFALGVAVDDTIHVVTAYHSEIERGVAAEAALGNGFRRVLPALIYTTLIVALGFSVLAASDFSFTRNVGLLTASVMLVCLLADLTLLPALLLRLERSSAALVDRAAPLGRPGCRARS
jgi:predicted RND superfamily exporter protein